MGLDKEEKQNRILGDLLKGVEREVKQRLEDLMLQDSLQVTQYLNLPMKQQGQQVRRRQIPKVNPPPAKTQVIEVFTREDVARRLLILGEPGSGKSTTLLQLAEELIEQATAAKESNNTFQVPVIFELSAWKNEQQSLSEWLIAQLKDNYSINKRVSQKWLENEQILPLLDGLDELGIHRQKSAIKAINQYLKEKISRKLVVCCRSEEYGEGNEKLNYLHGAYYLQPPKDSEIRDYLERLEQHQLWSKIESNSLMKELAQKPLFLNLMIPAFQGEAILTEEKLFEDYVTYQLDPHNHDPEKYPEGVPYTEEETKRWLKYLARQLEADSLSEFLIEKIQSYWLKPGNERLAFRLIYGLTFGLASGLIFGLIFELVLTVVAGLISGLIFGLISGLISGLKTEIKNREIPNQGIKEAWKKTLIIPIITFPFFASILPLTTLATGVTFKLQTSIATGLAIALGTSLTFGGRDCIQHLTLRLILCGQNKIPWNYSQFLDYAVERRLLQKTGGKYRFVHGSLRKHFCGKTLLPPHTIETTKNQWLGWILIIFLVLIVLVIGNSIHAIDSNRSSLLTPMVQTDDIILSDIITYRWRNYQRGDVIELCACKSVEQGLDCNLLYIMRIVGLPEETWQIKQGQMYVNDKLLSADYLDSLPIEDYDTTKIEVPVSQYLVIGKSITGEEETLVSSLVSEEDILSRVIFRILPLKRWGRVK